MSRCIALVHSRKLEPFWVPCEREAMPGGRFCARHRESLEGALLGYYFMFEARHAEKEQREKARAAKIQARRRRTIRKRLRRKTAA
jgi:hypothetical protein